MEAAPKPFSRKSLEAFSMMMSFFVLFFLLLILVMPAQRYATSVCRFGWGLPWAHHITVVCFLCHFVFMLRSKTCRFAAFCRITGYFIIYILLCHLSVSAVSLMTPLKLHLVKETRS